MWTSYCSGSFFFLHFLGPHSTRNWNFINLFRSIYDCLLLFLFRKPLVCLTNKSATEWEVAREAHRQQTAFQKCCIFIIALTFHFRSNFTAFWYKCKLITFVLELLSYNQHKQIFVLRARRYRWIPVWFWMIILQHICRVLCT